jgi:hypothetical protein
MMEFPDTVRAHAKVGFIHTRRRKQQQCAQRLSCEAETIDIRSVVATRQRETMCEVCAIFGAGEHWSDFGRLRDERFPFADIQHYRSERRRRIALLNRLFVPLAVTCEDWDGEALMLFDRQGRSRLAPTLSDVWPALEALTSKAIDPLDRTYIAGLDHG